IWLEMAKTAASASTIPNRANFCLINLLSFRINLVLTLIKVGPLAIDLKTAVQVLCENCSSRRNLPQDRRPNRAHRPAHAGFAEVLVDVLVALGTDLRPKVFHARDRVVIGS